MRFLLIVALLLLAAVTIFALNNPAPVNVRFLRWQWATTLALAMIAAALAGAVVVYVASLAAHQGLKARLRTAESRLADKERQRPASPPPSPPSRV
ncbi:MAG: lipopolysaccharide assembly protein LapA domain-containing protein [bacterium]